MKHPTPEIREQKRKESYDRAYAKKRAKQKEEKMPSVEEWFEKSQLQLKRDTHFAYDDAD